MKPQHFAALTGSLLVIALVLIFAGKPAQPPATGGAEQPVHMVTVTGEGEVRVRPDQARITFGVVTHGASAGEAEALMVASSRKVQTALSEAGAEEGKVEISHLVLSTTTYQDFSGVTRISGFKASTTVEGTTAALTRVQSMVEAGLGAGATSVDGIVYALENPELTRQAAMRAALDNARTRAAAMVRAEGGTLGELRSMEVLLEPDVTASSPGGLLFRARVRATFEYNS